MIYICEDCHFLFWSDVETEQCPDCGRQLFALLTKRNRPNTGAIKKNFIRNG
jgi:rRNA maturation endonuclease Nob1